MSAIKKPVIETVKFLVRLALLAGVPVLVAHLTDLKGDLQTVVGIVLPIVLPIIDKYVHEDPRIKANGLLPI